jgi:hypothetical protein
MKYRTLTIILCLLINTSAAYAEVTRVVIASRATVANGQPFGATGPYEKLTGTIEFALDPSNTRNARIVDLQHAPRGNDGRVHFSSDIYVLRPADPARGNGVLLFEIANRGRKGLLTRFNRAAAINDPTTSADFGDGFLMREGYTLVWIGWEFDLDAPLLRADLPRAALASGPLVDQLSLTITVNQRSAEAFLIDEPGGRPPVRYPPAVVNNPTDTLTVRDRYWDKPSNIPREQWRFVTAPNGTPALSLEGGFEPGRIYEITYRATGARVTGAGLAAIRDAAAALRYRSDLPVRGRSAYVFGASQSGRFLREFLYQGFNVDERDRRVFDAVWPHIAGASRGPFNERFAATTHGRAFTPTRFPFTDLEQRDPIGKRDGLLVAYRPEQQPKIFYTNTSVEYWGGGRAAALTHTTLDGEKDAETPPNVRIYLLAGTQHGEGAFPPVATRGQQPNNPTPHANVMRALLRALHRWVADNTRPPDSKHPRLSDRTLAHAAQVRFPTIPSIGDPRRITGPAQVAAGTVTPLPHLVPQVDADGNELAGIRVAELAVPLATTTGWNFRAESVGNSSAIYSLLGSYIPFAQTRAEREAGQDPRLSIDERYRGREDYLEKIRAAAQELIRGGYLLQEDFENVVARASAHWDYATRSRSAAAQPSP